MGWAALRETNPLVRKEHIFIVFSSLFFSTLNLQNKYYLLGFDAHLNALQKCDALFYYCVIFYILYWFIISNISADLSAYSRLQGTLVC